MKNITQKHLLKAAHGILDLATDVVEDHPDDDKIRNRHYYAAMIQIEGIEQVCMAAGEGTESPIMRKLHKLWCDALNKRHYKEAA
ncbi:MAG: hypothetical protein ACR2Q3_01660 [Woeseiaceae bacterium]